jgi:DNA-binding PadR family transcriptional regulator
MGDTRDRPEKRESGIGFLILVIVADAQARTGGRIIEDIQRLFGVRLNPDTLYGALARLARRGLVEPLVTKDPRQPYRISGGGAEIVRDELTRLADVARNRLHTGNRSVPLPFRPGELGQDAVMGSYPLYRQAALGGDRTRLTSCEEEGTVDVRHAT